MKRLASLLLLTALCLSGCAYTCTSYEAGLSAGRSFADQDVLGPGTTLWNANLKFHFDRDRR